MSQQPSTTAVERRQATRTRKRAACWIAFRDSSEVRVAPAFLIDLSWSGALISTPAALGVGRLAYLAPINGTPSTLVRIARMEFGRDLRRRYGLMSLQDALPTAELAAGTLDDYAGLALGVGWPCTKEDLRGEFRRQARRHHPDLGGTANDFVRIKRQLDGVMQLFTT